MTPLLATIYTKTAKQKNDSSNGQLQRNNL